MNTKSANDYLYEMANRAAQLSKMKAVELRLLHPDNIDGIKSFSATIADCIEAILIEEFLFENDFEVPE